MATADEPSRLTALQALLLVALFAALALLFARLLRPLAVPAAPSAPSAAPAMPAPAAPVQAGPAPAAADTALPVVDPAGSQPAAVAPSTAYSSEVTGPRVAIVLTEVGEDPAQARAAIAALPAAVGLAFSPYPDVRALARAARADGHEVIAELPMQPKAWPRVSPGSHTLRVDAAADDNLARLDWALARVEGATAVTGIMGSAFTESAVAMRPVLAAVGDRGLAYLDSRASARSVGVATARAAKVRAAANDRFLDEGGDVVAQLAALEREAKRRGTAIGYARPLPATVDAIKAWAAALDDRGVRLVPPSSLAL